MMFAETSSSFFQITIGNLVSMGGMIIALIVGWQKLKDKVEQLEKTVDENEARLETVINAGMPHIISTHADRLTRIEHQLENLPAIAADVSWIKQAIQQRSKSKD